MKKIFTLFFASIIFSCIYAHDAHYSNADLHHWKFSKNKNIVECSFYMMKDNNVLIEDAHERILSFPYKSLSTSDKNYVVNLLQKIATLNHKQKEISKIDKQNTTKKNQLVK